MFSKTVLRCSNIASRICCRSQVINNARISSFHDKSTNQTHSKQQRHGRNITKIETNSSQGKNSSHSFKYVLAAGLMSLIWDDTDGYDAPQKKYIINLRRTYPFLEIKKEEPKPETPEDMLIMTLKRAVYFMQQEKFELAEQMLHLALRMAQDMQDANGITYCFDIMANLAFETKQYEKSERLFVVVMQRLMAKGSKENDIEILHLSAKIARIASKQGNVKKAEQGFSWVIDGILKRHKNEPSNNDLYELLGLVRDWYGKHLMVCHRYFEARENLSDAYNIYTQLHGKTDAEVVDLLNNLAAACLEADDLIAADVYIDDALKLAKEYPELLATGIYQANKGLICLRKGLIKEAKDSCTKALKIASKSEAKEGEKQAKYCLEQIAKALKA